MTLTLRGISRSYQKAGQTHQVLRLVDLDVPSGQAVALLGKSAAGKSTLLRALAGLETLDNGDAWLGDLQYLKNGRLTVPGWRVARSIGLVFQDYKLFPNMRVERNLTLPAERVLGAGRHEARALAEKVARLLDIQDVLQRYPSEISGGQAQRVALARALILRPTVLALDEVTSALDPITVGTMLDALRSIRVVEGAVGSAERSSILLVTHALRFAESFVDRILFLSDGAIVEDLPAREFRNSQNPAVQGYIRSVL